MNTHNRLLNHLNRNSYWQIGFSQKTALYGTAGHEAGATAEEILSYNQFTPPSMSHIDPKINVDLWLFSYTERNMRGTQPMFTTERQKSMKSSSESRQRLRRTVFEHVVLQQTTASILQTTSAPPCYTLLTERLHLQDLYSCSEGSVVSFWV